MTARCAACATVLANRSVHLALRETGRSQIGMGRTTVAIVNYASDDCGSLWQQWDTGDWYPGNQPVRSGPRLA